MTSRAACASDCVNIIADADPAGQRYSMQLAECLAARSIHTEIVHSAER